MAKILAGDAKVQVNLVDKSVYAPVVGSNILAILGVFDDGATDVGNYVTTRSELVRLLGDPVQKYNNGTKINYSYDALYTALSQHSSIYVFRVTDGSEKLGVFAPTNSIFKITTKNKTKRWNGVTVILEKVATFSTPDNIEYQKYLISFYNSNKELMESYEGNLKPDSDSFIMTVVNANSSRFRIELTSTLADDSELTDTQVQVSKFGPTSTVLTIPLMKDGSVSDLKLELKIRLGSTRESAMITTVVTKDSTTHTSWSIEQQTSGLLINVTNTTNIKLSTMYSLVNSYVAYELVVKNSTGNIVELSKIEKANYIIELGNLPNAYDASEKTEVTDALTGNKTTTCKKEVKNTPTNKIEGGASGLDDIGIEDYVRQASLLESTTNYPVNIISAPGVVDPSVHKFIDSIIVSRGGDALQIYDIPDYSEVTDAIKGTATYNTNYAATFYPWVEITSVTGAKSVVPPSGEILAMIGYSDSVGEPWFAAAGMRRGILRTATGVSQTLTQGERDLLQNYPNIINPIVVDSGGVLAWGNTTSYRISSKLREISVIRLAIYLTKVLRELSKTFLFEPNTTITHDQWKLEVNGIMDEVMHRQGVYDYKVLLGEQDGTMTAYHFDRNIAKAKVMYKPVGYIHWFVVDMEIHKYGSSYTISEE